MSHATGTTARLPATLITLLVGVAYLVIQFDWSISLNQLYNIGASQQAELVGAGNRIHAVGYGVAALTGLLLLAWPPPHPIRYRLLPLAPYNFYLALCLLSLFWSIDPSLTSRRLLILFGCLACGLGIARHLSDIDFLRMIVAICLSFLILGIGAELYHTTFLSLDPGYRFAGTVHPNGQGAICATLVIVSACQLLTIKTLPLRKLLWIFLFCVGLLFLVLTKSRSSAAGCSAAIYCCLFWGRSARSKTLLLLLPLLVLSSVLLVLSLTGSDLASGLIKLFSLGRQTNLSEVISFNGRVPLWIELYDYFQDKALFGHGYQAFWTPTHIEELSRRVGWTVAVGHSVLVDLLLYLGSVGCILFLTSLAAVFINICLFCHPQSRLRLLSFGMFIFVAVFSIFESSGIEPKTFEAFVASSLFFRSCLCPQNPGTV